MKDDGINSEADIGITGNLYGGIYQSTLNYFSSNNYILNKNFFIFPYDWRQENISNTSLLEQKINTIIDQTGAEKVDLVAHSMGGLISRHYIYSYYKNHSENAAPIRKYIELGVPHLGSVKALKTLIFGDCLIYDLGFACPSLAPSEVKDLSHNMLSLYELLPSKNYDKFYNFSPNDPVPFKINISGEYPAKSLSSLLTARGYALINNPNIDLITSLASIGSSFYGVPDVTIIAGYGEGTLGQITENYKQDSSGKLVLKSVDQLKINGDGTVPLYSASLDDPVRNISLRDTAEVYYTKQTHSELVANGPALNLVKNILRNDSSIPSGVSTQPTKLKGKLFGVFSPVLIDAYDKFGNHTGPLPNGDFETNIPGSSYDILGESKFIFLPEDGVYTLKFKATDQGSFDFKITSYKDDSINKTVLYQDIALSKTTKGATMGETTYDTSKNISPTLLMDQDGNGTIDRQIRPTSITGDPDDISDKTPPTTSYILSGTEGAAKWFRSDVTVVLSAVDNTLGTGVRQIEYSLDGGKTFQKYNQAFLIKNEGLTILKYRSIDNANNVETTKSININIDRTSPEAKIFFEPGKTKPTIAAIDTNRTIIRVSRNPKSARPDDCYYLIQDLAGNSIGIYFSEQSSSGFRISGLSYNNNTILTPPTNRYTFIGSQALKTMIEENYSVNNDIKIRIKYDSKLNKSYIYTKETSVEKLKEVKNGLILLNLVTNKINIEYSY